MAKQTTGTYSRITRHAATLLGKQIRIARKERKMTRPGFGRPRRNIAWFTSAH